MAKVSQEEFNNLKKQAQHKELVDGLSTIAKNLEEQNSNEEFKNIIVEKFDQLNTTIGKIEVSPEINIPEQKQDIQNNVNVDFTELVSEIKTSVDSLKNNIETIAQAIDNRPRKWKFKVDRDKVGYINEVDATAIL